MAAETALPAPRLRGLLVTAHDDIGLPEIYRTATATDLAAKLVDHLMAGRTPPFTPEELSECFARRREKSARCCSISTIFTSGGVRPRAEK